MNKNTCRRKYKKTAQKPFLHKVLNQNALSFRYIKNNEKFINSTIAIIINTLYSGKDVYFRTI